MANKYISIIDDDNYDKIVIFSMCFIVFLETENIGFGNKNQVSIVMVCVLIM